MYQVDLYRFTIAHQRDFETEYKEFSKENKSLDVVYLLTNFRVWP